MNPSLHHLSVKNRRVANQMLNALLNIILSWAAIDHLIKPGDLEGIFKSFGHSAVALLKSVSAIALVAVTSPFAQWRSHGTPEQSTFFANPL